MNASNGHVYTIDDLMHKAMEFKNAGAFDIAAKCYLRASDLALSPEGRAVLTDLAVQARQQADAMKVAS